MREVIGNCGLDFGVLLRLSCFRYLRGCVEGPVPFVAVCSVVGNCRCFGRSTTINLT